MRKFCVIIAVILIICICSDYGLVQIGTERSEASDLNVSKMSSENKSMEFANPQKIEVTHLFTHCLIAYPQIAFAKENEMRFKYDNDCLTVNEFKAILQSLYERGYMLVSPHDIYNVKNDAGVKKNIDLNGKKPLILSFDDVNYYSKKANLGMNDKLIVKDGQLATFTKNAKRQINYNNEVVTILENFVKLHPDFSFNNAKGTICLTGFDGVLGYRTNRDSATRIEETKSAKVVVDELKKRNWKFANHSYGHFHMKALSNNRFNIDTKRWRKEVETIVGKTDIYVYPYGESEIVKNGKISEKHLDLIANDYKFFWGVGSLPFFSYLPFEKMHTEKYLFMDRIPLDGYSLRNIDLSKYFDAEKIIDNSRPKKLDKKKNNS